MNESLWDGTFPQELTKARQRACRARKSQSHHYQADDSICFVKVLYTRDYHCAKTHQLGARSFGPFNIRFLIVNNALRKQLPPNVHIHDVVHAEQTRSFINQPADLLIVMEEGSVPVVCTDGMEYVVGDTLALRKQWKKFQFITLVEPAPINGAAWHPSEHFVDDDVTKAEVLQAHISKHDFLIHFYLRVVNNSRYQ